MSGFSELIKNFDKIREYMRDFYIYGFKTRGEYTYKSARTYDNERRRIESWLADYLHWEDSAKGRRVFLSVDSSRISQNPLYTAWKSKSFTRLDIMLHFYILDCLAEIPGGLTAEQLSDLISHRYGEAIDTQTARGKLKEYARQGILICQKQGRAQLYYLAPDTAASLPCSASLTEAVKFFQGIAPFGFVGSTILDSIPAKNDHFYFKHHFIVHTLEDSILYRALCAMEGNQEIEALTLVRKTGRQRTFHGIPLKILVSSREGRRYLCIYDFENRRFSSLRLDCILNLTAGSQYSGYEILKEKLERNLPRCWGASFGNGSHVKQLLMKLWIDEKREAYVLERLRRECRGGTVERIRENTYLFSISLFDANEALPWIKSFTGRVLSLECSDPYVREKFYNDMDRLYDMYFPHCAK